MSRDRTMPERNIVSVTGAYPCHRGGGVLWWHEFRVSRDGVCCIYCGARPTEEAAT